MTRACLILAAVLGCFGAAALAQSQPDKKNEPAKGKDAGKSKSTGPGKEAPEPNPSTDALLKRYLELVEELKSLKKQAKVEEVFPSFCKLHGKLDGDIVTMKAEFLFKTEQPASTVFLGMLGGHLMNSAELDGQPAIVDAIDKRGFVVRVDKEGIHRVTMNLRVRVDDAQKGKEPLSKAKKTSGAERGIELGLPNAAGGSLQLDLPGNVKELRFNDDYEKPKTPGRWFLPIGRSKQMRVAWREPLVLTGNATVTKVEGQISVRVESSQVHITADLNLGDLVTPTKEWKLLLPAQAEAKATSLSGMTVPLTPPEGGSPYYTFKPPAGGSERWQVTVTVRRPRPGPGGKLAVGPFLVVGAIQQSGTIGVETPAEASLGQRLIIHRNGAVTQIKNGENESSFQYVAPVILEKNVKPASIAPPLELEWRYDKNQLETQVEHALKWTTLKTGWLLDVETRIKVKTLFAGASAMDMRLPLPRQRGWPLAGTIAPGLAFPGLLPWGGMWADPVLEKPAVFDEFGNLLDATTPDAFGKTRITWGSSNKKPTLVFKSTYQVAAGDLRLKVELPRPLNTQDRGAKLTIQADDAMELLYGPLGAEETVPELNRFSLSWDAAPARIDLAWRPHQREITAEATIDIVLREHTAEVRQTLAFPWEPAAAGGDPQQSHVRLLVPRGIDRVTVASDGDAREDLPQHTVWFRPNVRAGEKVEIDLHFDVVLGKKTPDGQAFAVPMIWPASVSRKDVKVRVWSHAGGVRIRLADDLVERGVWKERGIEVVPGRDQFPVLVLQAVGAHLPLTLRIEDVSSARPAAFLAERGLIQVAMNADGSQKLRARFLVRKFNTDQIEIEMPMPVASMSDRPTFFLMGKQLNNWETIDPTDQIVRLKLGMDPGVLPSILDIQYTIPADALERNTTWRTELAAPVFRSPVALGNLRWQVMLPTPTIAAVAGRQVRLDSHWTMHGWLPTPNLGGTDLEAWLLHGEFSQTPVNAAITFAEPHLQPVTVYHLPRQWWLFGCSGLLLILTLGVYFSPAPRFVFSLFLLGVAIAFLLLGVLSPGLLPAVLFGCQPGIVLLVLFVSVHWVLQERERRQMVFLPAFSRTKPSSTVTMPAAKRPREPSTVDAPPAPDGGPPSTASATGS